MGYVNLIAAVGRRGQIGLAGEMPWGRTEKADLRWFARMTEGSALIAGPKTARTLPSPLGLHRELYVWRRETDPQEMIDTLFNAGVKGIFIVGGAATYRAFMPYVDRFFISRVAYDGPADTWFPFEELALRQHPAT